MEVINSLVGFGIDIAPVPGLKTAFEILSFIWENVDKASNNRKALKNLAVSTGDILAAVNHLLSHGKINEHIQELVCKLEKVLDEIRNFAAEHVSMNMFKSLIRNIDVEGKIERFQSRLQTLSMAFNIAAYSAIESQLERILQGQSAAAQPLLPSVAPGPSAQDRKISSSQLKDPSKPSKQKARIKDYEPLRIGASFSKPCRIEVRNSAPVLTSLYEDTSGFTTWGLGTTKSKVFKNSNGFDIIHHQDSRTWTWTILAKIISVSLRNPAFPDWKNSMDIVFSSAASATAWFSWLQKYTSLGSISAESTEPYPGSYEVKVRRKCHCWMQKTPTYVERRLPDAKEWLVTVSGHPQNFKAYTTHFTYVNDGRQPFTRVYRSGDTIVQERFVRADNEEPTTARRFRFDTEEQSRTWFAVWKDCARDQAGFKEPLQIEVTTKCLYTIKLINKEGPILASKLWSEIPLRDWRPPRFKSIQTQVETVARTTSFTWMLDGKKVTVYAALASQPDWFDVLEIVFHDSKSSHGWFSYLTDNSLGGSAAPLTTRPEAVSVTNTRVCWIHITKNGTETRRATSNEWHPIFGKYTSMVDHGSHLLVEGNMVLPHLRITQAGSTLVWEHRASANDPKATVSRHYRFGSKADAEKWYEIWKDHLQKVTSS